jgi:hypothetical protein
MRFAPLGVLCAAMAIVPARADDFTARFTVQIDASRTGDFVVTVREKKAPLAAARFREMVNTGFFDGCKFYRVIPGFLVQFGLSGNATQQHAWDAKGNLRDETHIEQPDWNMRGTIAFVSSGPNSRGTRVCSRSGRIHACVQHALPIHPHMHPASAHHIH